MENKKQPSSLSLERAAQAWCTETTSGIEMDVVLAVAFANILDHILSKPWLGNATTREILDELKARDHRVGGLVDDIEKIMDLDYKTTE